jgi:acetoin utilization deacetylase AcuC-like enzyme
MRVTPEGFACMTRILLDLAEESCGGRLAMVLEGGYNVQGLTKCVRAVLLELLGETCVKEETLNRMVSETGERADRVIGQARERWAPYWK